MPGIRLACTLTADLSGLRGNVQRLVNPAGNAYWMIDYEIEIFFGRTSLCAAVVWEEEASLVLRLILFLGLTYMVGNYEEGT